MRVLNFKNFNKSKVNEDLDVVDQYNINIAEFDNELTNMERYRLEQNSISIDFDKSELIKLNLYFGILKYTYRRYDFQLESGGFGKHKIKFKGVINKKIKFDSSKFNNGKHKLDDYLDGGAYYLIDGYIKVNIGVHEGRKSITLKFDNIDDVINLFKKFEISVV